MLRTGAYLSLYSAKHMDPSFQNRLDPFQRIILILHITRKADAHRIISQAKFLSNTTAAVKLQMLIITAPRDSNTSSPNVSLRSAYIPLSFSCS